MCNKRYTSIDLFCGCGGQAKGMELAGVRSLLAIDFDEVACQTFQQNFPDTKVLCADMTTIQKEDVEQFITENVDILNMSPSCQGFSLAK